MRASHASVPALVLGCSLALSAFGCGGTTDPTTKNPPPGGIEILVDDMGVPHIYAANDEDLFYGYGYQLASDRLLQIEMWRRFAYGRRSETLGADAPGSFGANALQDDQLIRMFNIPHFGRLDAELMKTDDPERWKLLQAWREGINARIEEVNTGKVALPFGFGPTELDFKPEPWNEEDPLVLQKMVQLGLDQTILYEVFVTMLQQLAPAALASVDIFKPAHPVWEVPPEDMPPMPKILPPPSSSNDAPRTLPEAAGDASLWQHLAIKSGFAGSNNWAVDGRFTANGKPMLAGDPHLTFTLMGLMYALHLNSKDAGGTFDVEGFAFAPAPGIFAGHNDKVMWAPTSCFGDVMDMWAVTLTGGVANMGGDMVPVVTRQEVIQDRSGSTSTITLTDVPGYGVIFPNEFVGVPLPLGGFGKQTVIGWTGFKARSSKYFLELDRAESIDEFDNAVERIPEMSYNWVAADSSGITYRVSLEVPARNPIVAGREPWAVMDGSDPLSYWRSGSLSLDQLPHGRASQRGFIVTANNDPFGFTADGRADNDPWYYGAFFDPGYRAKRIDDELVRLTQLGAIAIEDMQGVQMDVKSGMAEDLIPLLAATYAKVPTDDTLMAFRMRPDLDTLVGLITDEAQWDRRMARDSSGALAFHAFAHFVTGEVIEDDISLMYERVLEAAPFYILKVAILTLKGEFPNGDMVLQGGKDLIILRALDKTAAFLTQRFGGVDPSMYTFSDMRISNFDNAYGQGIPLWTVPTDGGEDTVNVAHSVFRANNVIPEHWVSDYGAVERLTGRFGDDGKPEIQVNFPIGNVADRSSPHFDDALDDWVEGRYRKMLYDRPEVDAAMEQRIVVRRP
jgi:penicillin amidase